jgi:hypothetical protein
MTDLRPGPSRDPLPDQLAGWFDREVHQAAADLRAAPLGTTGVRRPAGRPAFAPLVAVAVVVIAVVAGLTRLPGLVPGVEPTGSSSPGSSVDATPKSTAPAPSASIPALSVDSRYPDGIPSSLGGQRVARVTDLEGTPAGDGSFLLGGWSYDFSRIVYACVVQLEPAPSFGPTCGTPFLTQNPIMDEQPRVMLDGWTSAIPAGPVVLQVHRHDPRAAVLCPTERREACENMAVVERIVWAGDSTTATAPRTPTDTFMRLIEADPNLPQTDIDPLGYPGVFGPPAHFPPPLDECQPPYPDQAWTVRSTTITSVLVFPTIEAREAVDQDLTPSGFIGTTLGGDACMSTTDSAFSRRWVAVENVMVSVLVKIDGPTDAQAKFIDEVHAALSR